VVGFIPLFWVQNSWVEGQVIPENWVEKNLSIFPLLLAWGTNL